MKALTAENDRLRADNTRMATLTVTMVDKLRTGVTPMLLQGFQDGLRQDLLWTESRIRAVSNRRTQRGKRTKRRFGHHEWWPECAQQLFDAWRARENRLNTRRMILRQAGDAMAWIVLREDPDVLIPLYAPRTHHLNPGIGLIGQVQIVSTALATGDFLVLESDLTRVLGVGDIVVVSADDSWQRPLAFELKSKGQPTLGSQVEIDLVTAVSDYDQPLYDRFCQALGLTPRVPGTGTPVPSGQLADLEQSARSHLSILTRVAQKLRPPTATMWPIIGRVATRALSNGYGVEIAEPNIAYGAVRAREGDNAEQALAEVVQDLQADGFQAGLYHITSLDIQRHDELSAYSPPIPLWPISADVRAAVLGDELLIVCVFHPEVWRRALAAEGIQLTIDGEEWVMTLDDATARFANLEVRSLTTGFAFGGISPTELAQMVRDGLRE